MWPCNLFENAPNWEKSGNSSPARTNSYGHAEAPFCCTFGSCDSWGWGSWAWGGSTSTTCCSCWGGGTTTSTHGKYYPSPEYFGMFEVSLPTARVQEVHPYSCRMEAALCPCHWLSSDCISNLLGTILKMSGAPNSSHNRPHRIQTMSLFKKPRLEVSTLLLWIRTIGTIIFVVCTAKGLGMPHKTADSAASDAPLSEKPKKISYPSCQPSHTY